MSIWRQLSVLGVVTSGLGTSHHQSLLVVISRHNFEPVIVSIRESSSLVICHHQRSPVTYVSVAFSHRQLASWRSSEGTEGLYPNS